MEHVVDLDELASRLGGGPVAYACDGGAADVADDKVSWPQLDELRAASGGGVGLLIVRGREGAE